jgi:hypothetical protein
MTHCQQSPLSLFLYPLVYRLVTNIMHYDVYVRSLFLCLDPLPMYNVLVLVRVLGRCIVPISSERSFLL